MKTLVCPHCNALFYDSYRDYFEFIESKKCPNCAANTELDEALKEIRIFEDNLELPIIQCVIFNLLLLLSFKYAGGYVRILLAVVIIIYLYVFITQHLPYLTRDTANKKPLYIINNMGIEFCASNSCFHIICWDDINQIKLYFVEASKNREAHCCIAFNISNQNKYLKRSASKYRILFNFRKLIYSVHKRNAVVTITFICLTPPAHAAWQCIENYCLEKDYTLYVTDENNKILKINGHHSL